MIATTMRLRSVFASLLAVFVMAASAVAGPVYVNLVVDPLTQADAGGAFDGLSTQSGPGTWHLYALDDTPGSLGIHNYNITLNNITEILHRSPVTRWDDDNDPGNGDFNSGFFLFRTANDTTPPVGANSNPLNAIQGFVGQDFIIDGFGREASDFSTKLPPGHNLFATTSHSWGDYATDPAATGSSGGNNWLFLAEGQYAIGTPPTLGAMRVQVMTALDNMAGTATIIDVEEQAGVPTTNMPTAFHDRVSASNPLLWYKLSESTGNAINSGSLGSTHDGVYNGSINRAVPTSGGDAGAGFNSTDDYIESLGASPLVGNPTFSIETLVFLPADGSAAVWGPFLHWGDGGGPNGAPQRTGREVYFSVQNANLNRTYAGFYNAGLRTTSNVPLGEWLHIVWTRDGDNSSAGGTTLYINGSSVLMEQDPNLNPGFVTAAGINVNSTVFRINRAADFYGTRHFTGTMDEIALYDRVLSAAEVRDHACSIVGLCGIPGDYNNNGTVDGADYVVWRKTDGTQAGYNLWRSHFGQTAGSGASLESSSAAIPEPATMTLIILAATRGCLRRRRVA